MTEPIEENRKHWDEVAEKHPKTNHYNIDSFLQGKSTLLPLEQEEVGAVSGKDILHLQCHFGLDTLSWAREGAQVTGVDFSSNAIQKARELAVQSGLDNKSEFIESDIYDLPKIHESQYDVVYTSYGVLGWLPDLSEWANVIYHHLRPGGSFYIAELHPFAMMLPADFDGQETNFYAPYFTPDEPLSYQATGTYADEDLDLEHESRNHWTHGLGEIITALVDTNLQLDFVNEHTFTPFKQFEQMEQDENGCWRFCNHIEIPLTVSIKAQKPI